MKTLTLLIVLMLTGCATSADPWTRQDTVMQIATTAAFAADAYTTTRIQYHPNFHEVGPARYVLGPQPKTSETWQYFGSMAVSHFLITRMMPAKWRPYWQGGFIIAHGNAAYKNCKSGMCWVHSH